MNVRTARILPQNLHGLIPKLAPDAMSAWIIGLSDSLSIAAFDRPAFPSIQGKSTPIDGALNGIPLPRPLVSTSLSLRSGQTRHVVVMQHAAEEVAGKSLLLSVAGIRSAFLDPTWLQSPLREPIDLVAGITPAATSRLARLLLSTIPSLLPKDLGAHYQQTVRTLVGLLRLQTGELASRCGIGTAGEVLSYRLPTPLPSLPASVVALSTDRIKSVSPSCMMLEANRILHVFWNGHLPEPPDFVVLGDSPLRLSAPSDLPDRQPFLPWLARRDEEAQKWGEDVLHCHALADKAAAAVLRERRFGSEHPPTAKIHLLAATKAGVMVWLDVADPYRLVSAVRLESGSAHADIPVRSSGQVRTHLQMSTDKAGKMNYRLRLVFGSGLIKTVQEGSLDPFSGCLPQNIETFASVEAGRDLALAWRYRIVPSSEPLLEDFGSTGPNVCLSLVVPFDPFPDMVRARASLVACESAGSGIEIIYTLAGDVPDAVRRLLAEAAAVYGAAYRLVSLPSGVTAPDLLLAGLSSARASRALVLGKHVLPEGPGWAERWIVLLSSMTGPALIGGTLLAIDGSVEHAGGSFSWTGRSAPAVPSLRGKGLPHGDLVSDTDLMLTEILCEDAVGLSMTAMEAVLAAGATSPDPATMLQLAAHRLGAVTDARGRFVRFAAPPEPDEVIDASGRWQMSALLAAADGLAPH